MDVSGVLIKTEFIVQSESEIFEGVNQFNSFIIDACVVVDCMMWTGVCDDHFFCLGNIYLKIVLCAPLCEVGYGVLVGCNRVIIIEECKYGCVIRVCGDG